MQKYFIEASLNLSKFGIGLDIKKNPPMSDIQIAIEKMIKIVNDKGKRLLITIDDVTKSKDVVSFASAFQCDEKVALRMALFIKGYSYAFQALGYIMWDKDCSIEEAISSFDERMSEYCYEKIWEDLSEKEGYY